jgi:2-polyprenyl-3-methyl-5-hydroxy-6-metoxy-1,4-benzoquinol methylase
MRDRSYQYDFSVGNPAMHSFEGRRAKAMTMLAVLGEAIGEERLARARVLNIGCSTGIIDEAFAPHVDRILGIDIDESAIEEAKRRVTHGNVAFEFGDAMQLHFAEGSFDIVICSQVYEHVPDADQLMREIERVLAPDGVCYFAATNRWCVVEQHYKLPFLSIIPVSLAHRYLRLLGRGSFYHERHATLRGLRRLTARFACDDFTRRLIANPDRYGTRYLFGSGVKRALVACFARLAYPGFPGYIWLLRKRNV